MDQVIYFIYVVSVFIGTCLFVEGKLKSLTNWSSVSVYGTTVCIGGIVLYFAVIPVSLFLESGGSSAFESLQSYIGSSSIFLPIACLTVIIGFVIMEKIRSVIHSREK